LAGSGCKSLKICGEVLAIQLDQRNIRKDSCDLPKLGGYVEIIGIIEIVLFYLVKEKTSRTR
jgi:hypothetical protein